MIQKLELDEPKIKNNLDYYNSIGLLIQDNLFITKKDKLFKFNINEIRTIYFKKERNLLTNYLLITLCLLTDLWVLGIENLLIQYKLASFIISIAILYYAFLRKIYYYKILLITDQSNMFSVNVDKTFKEDACELISEVKGRIKTKKQYLRVS